MENMPWGLRKATLEDLPKILAVETKVHVAPWTEKHFQGEFEKPYSQTLVITDDETDELVAGYIVYWLMFDECQILNLAVDLPYRGKGFGKQLVRKAIDFAIQKNLKRVLLNVRKSNMAAIQLYQSMHFTVSHVRKAFYSDGEDAYEMAVDLNMERLDF